MVSSCSQNNILSSDMHSHNHESTPNRLGCCDLAQTVAPRTPQMIRTPVPRMRSTARRFHLLTPQTAPRDDQDCFIPSRRRMNMDLCHRKLNSASKPCELLSSVACAGPPSAARSTKLAYEKQLLGTLCNVSTSDLDDDLQLKSLLKYGSVSPSMTMALGLSVYVMNESTRAVHEIAGVGITPLDENETSNYVRSVKWCTMDGLTHLLAVGTSAGVVRVYGTISNEEVVNPTLTLARSPVRALCWNDSQNWLTAGCANSEMHDYYTHQLSWSKDNVLAIGLDTMCKKEVHTSLKVGGGTVRALCWNDAFQWLTVGYDTGKLVSSLIWGQHHQELYSGHNFTDNEVKVWSYPKMERIQTLSYHQDCILSMDLSPDGNQLVSISADENLCFWKIDAAPSRRRIAVAAFPSSGSRFTIR
ncbi:hypothetical protein FisN_10Lu336 [Fistulifera solaris]|uniref:Uncharacterized protein n=1 Tax=Fistulifera solaris TaxID=1519565 RepID=A0A1Z5KFU0_FISSO|nr:hypothetical protein FisN_10Lu336 [Fistulifera solaris]|eukprot:GAX25119.1 hypothetical protein FisN_10Lu336 [Fistulifera solaris]